MRKKLIPSTFHRVMQSRARNKIRRETVQQLYFWLGGVEALLNNLNREQKSVYAYGGLCSSGVSGSSYK